ncbi:LAME_0D04148g1_1 [Lachancea meyersii CBS 8951]|uniref:Proteasome assembly chaperone 2 n=1 Tax=Lachancea meyersii CBS 8951 TaxID=1266667 RepID=A0A1G4J7Y8_9SACH|nr:LAME_0D04148g1_1 [Lachancea meyersii CBS 8951]
MSTLLLPLVSTGNVPQLVTDLILHSLSSEFEFVRELDSQYLFPFTGPLDYVKGSQASLYETAEGKTLTTPLELFYSSALNLYVVQQRSPLLQNYENNFCKEALVPLIEELQIEQLIIFDATDDIEESVAVSRLNRTPYSLGICEISQIDDIAAEFEQKLQMKDVLPRPTNNTLFKFTETSFQSGISAEQFTYKLCYHLLQSSKFTSCLKGIRYFNTYVQEGDNSEDAAAACDQLPLFVEGFPKITQYHTPVSWEGVYGVRNAPSSFEEGLYI